MNTLTHIVAYVKLASGEELRAVLNFVKPNVCGVIREADNTVLLANGTPKDVADFLLEQGETDNRLILDFIAAFCN